MARNHKRNEQITMPDDYNAMNEGNANTTSDGIYGDFTYTEIKVGNVTKPVRRAIVSNQISPAPFPENTHAPDQDPDIDPRNGVEIRDDKSLPPLKVYVADATYKFFQQPNAGEPDEKDKELMKHRFDDER